MDELNRLISELIKEKGGTKQQYLHLLDVISNHETKRTFDTKSIQDEGDPTNYGSGLYHFETGENKGGITAARRAVNVYKKKGYDIPTWLGDAVKGNKLDVGTLTPQQQSVLFLANHIEHPKSDFSKIWKGEQSIPEFWSQNHQADPDKKQRKLKEKKFAEDYKRYQEQGNVYPEVNNPAPKEDRWNAYTDELSKNDLYTAAKQSVKKNQIQFADGGYINKFENGGPIGPLPQQIVTKTRPDYTITSQVIPEYDTITPYVDKSQPYINKGAVFEQNVKKEFNDWYSNPITAKRLKEQTNYNPNEISNMLANAAATKMNKTNKVGLNENAQYTDKIRTIDYNKQDPNVIKHELSHASGLDQQLGEYLLKTTGYPSEQKTNYLGEVQNYLAKPHEAYGNFVEFRSALGWKPGQKIKDSKTLEKLMKQKKVDTNFSRTFDKENIVKALNTVADNSNISNQNIAALGGDLSHLKQNTSNPLYRRNFNTFGVGGRHEQNPLGGVPIGRGANGKPNTVEQGEAAYNFKAGKFIFSNRIKI